MAIKPVVTSVLIIFVLASLAAINPGQNPGTGISS